jgi:hypothetical protein
MKATAVPAAKDLHTEKLPYLSLNLFMRSLQKLLILNLLLRLCCKCACY